MKALLRFGTASALVIAASLAGGAVAQDVKTTETTKTTTTDPVTDAKVTTRSTTTTAPTTDETGAPATKTTSKTKTKVQAPGAETAETKTKTTATTSDAAAAAAAPATTAPGAPAATAGATAAAAPAPAAGANPTVGGAAMDATKTIVDNAAAAPNLTTLVSAVKAADLATTLAGSGPFTVFAPTNEAFGRLAPGTVETLMKPEQKANLAKVLKYHVVPGTLTIDDLKAKAAAGGGTATLTTVEGQPLTVKINKTAQGEAVELTDANGNKSYVETGDVRQSNGVVHVVNGVVVPKLG
jgi:uncharacterized surface protein with fasciclin (FAS1) repeats